MHPCRKCLVKAICTDFDCKSYRSYRNKVAIAIISIMDSLIIAIIISEIFMIIKFGLVTAFIGISIIHFIIWLGLCVNTLAPHDYPPTFKFFAFILTPYIVLLEIFICSLIMYLTKHPGRLKNE